MTPSSAEGENRSGFWGNFEEYLIYVPHSSYPDTNCGPLPLKHRHSYSLLPKWNDLDMEHVFPVVIISNGSLLLTRGRSCIVFILEKSDHITLDFE